MPPGYKTKLCPMWADKKQRCPYGDRCTFAHGEKELRKAPGAPSKEPEPKHAYLSFPSGDASSKLSEIEEKTGEQSLLGIVKHVRTHLQKASDFSVEWPDRSGRCTVARRPPSTVLFMRWASSWRSRRRRPTAF